MSIIINKVYTKSGDTGSTQTVQGETVSKDHPLIQLYGEFDELGVQIGFLRTYLENESTLSDFKIWIEQLKEIQNVLFDLGYAFHHKKIKPVVTEQSLQKMEENIDSITKTLATLKSFVLVGGNLINCQSHFCRVLTRRLERSLISWNKNSQVLPIYLAYLNRLSDLFYVFARRSSFLKNTSEYLWTNW